jgi:peptidoglycan L-alanyl-D-glutamate endopeptidase CwlK
MNLGQHQEAYTRDHVKLLLKAYELGYEVRKGESQRMPEMQAIYIQTGRSKTFDSMHLKKLADDLHFFKDGKLCYPSELGEFWENLSPLNRWGGSWRGALRDFKDEPHFERKI